MTTLTVITGGSSGLGAALLRHAVAAGDEAIDVSRSGPPDDVEATHVHADLRMRAGWDLVAAEVAVRVAGLGPGDRVLVIQCAGTITPIGPAGTTPVIPYDEALVLDGVAPLALGQRLLHALATHQELRRQLCVISSGAASSVYEGWSAYCAAKAAVDHWVRVVGAEQRRAGGVEVSAIAPGVVATPMQEQIRATDPDDFPDVDRFRALHEQGELRDPDATAAQLRQVLDRGVPTGSVLDLREVDG